MTKKFTITRRKLLAGAVAAGGAYLGAQYLPGLDFFSRGEPVSIFKASSYQSNLKEIILQGLKNSGFTKSRVHKKKILLKPNLVEPHRGHAHINTSPLLIEAAADAFFSLGASSVVAEGSGHTYDSYLAVEQSGLVNVLKEHRMKYVDLNQSQVRPITNRGEHTRLKKLFIPVDVLDADIFVSMPKMKTHHWVGVTLSMKNLFGIMPGICYGWPKNVLHHVGIPHSILDINMTVKPHLAIVDGIVGMEGDGPIMGTPVQSNVVVVGCNLPAVDATCARIMGIPPEKIRYLFAAEQIGLGPIQQQQIEQRGERLTDVETTFQLLDHIPVHREIKNS